jgi:hypothetical protein
MISLMNNSRIFCLVLAFNCTKGMSQNTNKLIHSFILSSAGPRIAAAKNAAGGVASGVG